MFTRFRCSGSGAELEGDGMTWGSWGSWSETCPNGYICGLQTRVKAPRGLRDDTALDNVFMCSGSGVQLEGNGLSWGSWGSWSLKCSRGAICGLRTRVEGPQGDGDDTALNDVQFFCCN
ncbi:hypothetical protein Q5P01_007162 [Channa striata]|uniref:Vitelline membrane outer layer 1-like protein n=1 Tax=Channa striata TaxID=64152 RepID=A0AA88SW43_CHASR|nr:hypothetical protein Q5P01_007162 [Channa striata]